MRCQNGTETGVPKDEALESTTRYIQHRTRIIAYTMPLQALDGSPSW